MLIWQGLGAMIGSSQTVLRSIENVFAPIPESKTSQWEKVMIDIITVGALGSAAPFFNRALKSLPAFSKSTTFDDTKDNALMLIGQGTTLAKDLLVSGEGRNE
ncbi:hypothetical protein GGTG_08390 [Gaeumannomyces tritici R3-111a-1]|uniref:Uncharacterized protein n=1 Tax=Gaeumannomyces tritici (strain R3-111a-1) TaxID=644352 RepID=J3P4F3_GAET3|nr:hypothetical protein GGTG_08390 [Gaeumannomyces tritici R3-111a-1]EJT74550.1 hypothetical protein GGTG_08390 [Gaeumannomyces tritici R3-111a-1]